MGGGGWGEAQANQTEGLPQLPKGTTEFPERELLSVFQGSFPFTRVQLISAVTKETLNYSFSSDPK